MALQIQNIKGTFEIEGDFTSNNAEKVKDHFNHLLDHYSEVVMCLKKVNRIDKNALDILNEIYKKASRRSKILFVLGKENRLVANSLKNYQLTHIFRNDY